MENQIRKKMEFEWEKRAHRDGIMKVMSSRYPYNRCDKESRKFINSIIEFIGEDLNNKVVLELGAGIGRLTKRLVNQVASMTCIDISREMIKLNKNNLGSQSKLVEYQRIFAQDYQPEKHFDAVVCSLVLIHNTDDEMFEQMVNMMSNIADTIFLFEHIDIDVQVSESTKTRSEIELKSSFYKFACVKDYHYKLFSDNIIFMKLLKKT